MTLPASGSMTAAMINVELGRASNAFFSMNGAAERALAGKPSGFISMSDFYGKSSVAPLSAVASPNFVQGVASASVGTTDTTTATPTGGTGPYTYAWTILSQSGTVTANITNSAAATTAFQAAGMTVGDSVSGTARCTVTATVGGSVVTNVVDFFIEKNL